MPAHSPTHTRREPVSCCTVPPLGCQVRAHKDYHESVQSGLNSAVQALSALVAVLGTISLVLFTDTHTETNEEAGASSGNATGTTAVGPDEQVVNDLQDTGIFSPRWW